MQERTNNRHIEEYPSLPDFRVDIRHDIYHCIIKAGKPITRAQIANGVERKKTTWLTERIEAMVADGLLTRSQSYWKNGVVIASLRDDSELLSGNDGLIRKLRKQRNEYCRERDIMKDAIAY